MVKSWQKRTYGCCIWRKFAIIRSNKILVKQFKLNRASILDIPKNWSIRKHDDFRIYKVSGCWTPKIMISQLNVDKKFAKNTLSRDQNLYSKIVTDDETRISNKIRFNTRVARRISTVQWGQSLDWIYT